MRADQVDPPVVALPPRADAAVLRALVGLAATITRSTGQRELIEAAAEAAREVLGATTLSLSRLSEDTTTVHTLINVGDLAPGEERWPVQETYRVADFPETLGFLSGHPVLRSASRIDDPRCEAAEVALLHSLGRFSSLKAAIVVEGLVWGEMWASRSADLPPFDDYDGDVAEVVSVLVAAGLTQARAWQQMEHLALTDSLTGLANRRSFDEQLRRAIHRAQGLEQPLCLAIGDVNGLKHVNDTLGHAAGDDALRHVAHASRQATAAVRGASAARLGGDEFVVVLPGLEPLEALSVATVWCEQVRDGTHPITLACGVAGCGPILGYRDPRELLRAADIAQYRAKTEGSLLPLLA